MNRFERHDEIKRALKGAGSDGAQAVREFDPGPDLSLNLALQAAGTLTEEEAKALKNGLSVEDGAKIDEALIESGRYDLVRKGVEGEWLERTLPAIVSWHFFSPKPTVPSDEVYDVAEAVFRYCKSLQDNSSNVVPGKYLTEKSEERACEAFEALLTIISDDQADALVKEALKRRNAWAFDLLEQHDFVGYHRERSNWDPDDVIVTAIVETSGTHVSDPGVFVQTIVRRLNFQPDDYCRVIRKCLEQKGDVRDATVEALSTIELPSEVIDELNDQYDSLIDEWEEPYCKKLTEIVTMGADHPGVDDDYLRAAIENGRPDQVRSAIDAGIDPGAYDLYAAAEQAVCTPEVLGVVLKSGFDQQYIDKALKKFVESGVEKPESNRERSYFDGDIVIDGLCQLMDAGANPEVLLSELMVKANTHTFRHDASFFHALLDEVVKAEPNLKGEQADAIWSTIAEAADNSSLIDLNHSAAHGLFSYLIKRGYEPGEDVAGTIQRSNPQAFEVLLKCMPARKRNALTIQLSQRPSQKLRLEG